MKSLNELIKQNLSHLNQNDMRSLDYISTNIKNIKHLSIEGLAESCYVSRTTILRLVKKLGFSGYSEFKAYTKFLSDESNITKTSHTIDSNFLINDIIETNNLLNKEIVSQLCNDFLEAENVIIIGSWILKSSAYYTVKRLNYYDFKFKAPQNDEEIEINYLRNINSNSIVIFLSVSGETQKIIDFAKLAIQKGAKTVSITSLSSNSLSKLCDTKLYAKISLIKETVQNECIASNIAFDYILEELFLTYLSKINIINYNKTEK